MRLSRRAAVVLAAALLGPALPSLAVSSSTAVVAPSVTTIDIPGGSLTAAISDADQLVGVTWTAGSPRVDVRWRTPSGWTDWETPEDDSDVPVAEERARARPGTEPVWRPAAATAVEARVTGSARGLQLVKIGDGAARTVRSVGTPAAHAADSSRFLARVHTRADWGADESIRKDEPSYANTAGGNDYRPQDYAYHVKARGWSDLGYNLVAGPGASAERRAGSPRGCRCGARPRRPRACRQVRRHLGGLKPAACAPIGDMTTAAPTEQTVDAMAKVAAYAGATWQFDPQGEVTLTSKGSPRYRSGTKVRLGRVHGHRDTGRTACPGALYDRLADIRRGAGRLLGPAPQITDVRVTGAPVHAPTPLVVTGDLSRDAPWVVEVHHSDGTTVARATGDDARPHLEWNGLRRDAAGLVPAEPGEYTWHVLVDDGYHPVARRDGPVEVGLPLVPV